MRKIIKKCSIEDFNNTIEYLRSNGRILLARKPKDNETVGRFKVFVFKSITTCTLVYKDLTGNGKVIELQTKLDDSFNGVTIHGGNAFAVLQKAYKAPQTNDKTNAPFSIGISPYRNKKFIGKRVPEAYGYDMNSAYPYGMLKDLPDTSKPLGMGKVNKGEYGFGITGLPVKEGEMAIYRFPLMESPYKRFVEVQYNKKKNAKSLAEKNTAKFIMNAAIGALQNHNCFLRAAIINNFHMEILEIMKKYGDHILSSNTDSIVSDIRIPEIEANLGNEIGQWKLEHQGAFAISNNGYSTQWNLEKPTFGAGKSKTWFKDGWDILVDEIPVEGNLYDLDTKTCRIVRK